MSHDLFFCKTLSHDHFSRKTLYLSRHLFSKCSVKHLKSHDLSSRKTLSLKYCFFNCELFYLSFDWGVHCGSSYSLSRPHLCNDPFSSKTLTWYGDRLLVAAETCFWSQLCCQGDNDLIRKWGRTCSFSVCTASCLLTVMGLLAVG